MKFSFKSITHHHRFYDVDVDFFHPLSTNLFQGSLTPYPTGPMSMYRMEQQHRPNDSFSMLDGVG